MERMRSGASNRKKSLASKETTPSSTEEETSGETKDTSSRSSLREERDTRGSVSPRPVSSTSTSPSPIAQLMTRTGYTIYQQNNQRRYGPPPGWTGPPPKRGCEIFIGKIPRDCFEDELVPVIETAGPVYEMRLMMDHNYCGMNRGYAFVVYCKAQDAKKAIKLLNEYEIRKGRTLGVCMSVDNCRLFVGGIPKRLTKQNIREEMEKVTDGVTDIIMYPAASDKTKNRGFAFVEYATHRAAAMARRKLINGHVQLWNHVVAVDWAEPELEVDEETMATVKILYVRNLMLRTTEAQLNKAFSNHAPVERVKKIRDYAFVHFNSRNGALTAMKAMNGSVLDDAVIEVTLAKPVDKETQVRNPPHRQKSPSPPNAPPPPFGILPIDYSMLPSLYFPPSPKVYSRNSMGNKVVRTPPSSKGKSRSFYPPHSLSFGHPQAQLVFPASPVHGPYMPQYMDSPKRPQISEEAAIFDVIPGLDISPAHPHQAPPPQHPLPPTSSLPLKQPRVAIQVLEELCMKSNWGQPLYCLHSTSTSPEGPLFQYKVYIPALSTTYIPSKLSRSIEESQYIAAEYALVQMGYSIEGASYSPLSGVPPPLAPVDALAPVTIQQAQNPHHGFVGLPATPKTLQSRPAPPTWSPDPALLTGFEATPFPIPPPPPPHLFSPHTELYHHRGF